MSNITHGMNPEEVQALGQQLQSVSEQIQQIVSQLEHSVSGTTWVGPDAQQFKTQWWPQHKNHLTSVANDLHGFGQSAKNNASEQLNVSGH